MGFDDRQTRVGIWARPPTCCTTLGKSSPASEPRLPELLNESQKSSLPTLWVAVRARELETILQVFLSPHHPPPPSTPVPSSIHFTSKMYFKPMHLSLFPVSPSSFKPPSSPARTTRVANQLVPWLLQPVLHGAARDAMTESMMPAPVTTLQWLPVALKETPKFLLSPAQRDPCGQNPPPYPSSFALSLGPPNLTPALFSLLGTLFPILSQ